MSLRRVAFLRGLNVGGHRVKMDELRRIFSDLGMLEPETLLASGNVVFGGGADDRAAVEARIEGGLAEALGYDVATFVRTVEEVAGILDDGPVRDDELKGPDYVQYVILLKEPPDADVIGIFASLDSERDSFRPGDREVHWLSRGKISESPLFGGGFERATRGVPNTMRNANTLRRLVAKFGTPGSGGGG